MSRQDWTPGERDSKGTPTADSGIELRQRILRVCSDAGARAIDAQCDHTMMRRCQDDATLARLTIDDARAERFDKGEKMARHARNRSMAEAVLNIRHALLLAVPTATADLDACTEGLSPTDAELLRAILEVR